MADLYFPFPLNDGSRICVERFERLHEIPFMLADSTVPAHSHEFYEMVLIQRGSCRHVCQQNQTTLLPGDLFLIPPHRSHAYQFTDDVHHYNCQFFVDSLPSEWLDDVQGLRYDRLQVAPATGSFPGSAAINRQGILHLDRDETSRMGIIFELILSEQQNPRVDSERMKRTLLRLALARLSRVRAQQYPDLKHIEPWKRQMINDTLAQFERQLAADWDTAEIAAEYHISASYFRSIFKEITGLPPRQYLNRMRIVHAVSMIQNNNLSLTDAAQAIGIYDLNYFSRLCKLVTGFTPSHFRRTKQETPAAQVH